MPDDRDRATRDGDDAPIRDVTEEFERALAEQADQHYMLRLYVTGMTEKSARAIESIRSICDQRLQGRYELEVVDIYQRPELVGDEQIMAAPTLVKKLPPPLRKLIGDMSDEHRVLMGLDLKPKE